MNETMSQCQYARQQMHGRLVMHCSLLVLFIRTVVLTHVLICYLFALGKKLFLACTD